MLIKKLLKPFKSCLRYFSILCVFLFLSVIFIFPKKAVAQKSCIKLFIDSPKLDSSNYIKNYTKYMNDDKYIIDIKNQDIRNQFKYYFDKYGEQEVLHYLSKEKRLEAGFNTVLGQIFDLVNDNTNRKIKVEKSPIFFDEVQNRLIFKNNAYIKTNAFDNLYKETLKVEKLDQDHTLITVSSIKSKNETELQSALKWRFRTMYYGLVNWRYRAEGLVDNKIESNFIMLDDEVAYANKLNLFEFSLTFNNQVLEKQLSYLNGLISDYQSTSSESKKKEILNEISNNSIPYMPSAGMVQSKPILTDYNKNYKEAGMNIPLEPVELKRYFKNDYIDPLNTLNIEHTSDEVILRHKMMYTVIEKLPPETPLEIHVHSVKNNPIYSVLLIRNYARLGFNVNGHTADKKYQDSEITVLSSKREIVLENIKKYLDKK